MSAPRRRAVRFMIAAGYVAGMAALAGFAAWPIYVSADFLLVAVVAPLVGAGIAVVSALRSWPLWLTALVTAGALLVAGVALAVPARRGDVAQWPQSALEVATGAVTGFKDLVTVDLPIGSYRNLLVPVLVVLLVGTLLALRLSWRSVHVALGGAAVALGMTFFGLAFGSTVASAPLVLGPVRIPAPREMLIGAVALVLSVLWLCWLALDERRSALRRAADTSGVRLSRRPTASDSRRALLAGGMVLVSLAAAGVAAPAIAGGQPRDVLRTAAGPDLDLSQHVSPLAAYRSWFTDDRYGDVLFRVTAKGGPLPDRIRIATLAAYDGSVYRPLDPGSGADERYVRVPSGRDAGPGPVATARIEIEGLDDIWLPTFGRVQEVTFAGAAAADLADGFYYNAATGSGIEDGRGLRGGDAYTVHAALPEAPALIAIAPPGVSGATVEPPESLVTWMEQQDAGSGGAALATLVSRLRERGYLSHALRIDPAQPPAWVTDLGDYAFQPSAAGHSLARIDALFRRLLERESAVDARGGTFVAAIGDDEQFSVAVALLAQQLGFPARVVVGTRLAAVDGLSACTEGVCRAGDVTAWTEVQSSTGEWIPVDATPQHTEPVNTETLRQRDPENPTDVRPETADEVIPPDPVQQDTGGDEPPTGDTTDLSPLWAGLRIAAVSLLVLLILLGPFVLVIAAKAWRRRARRSQERASSRIVGGWDEYVDAAVDHGLAPPAAHTRTELVELHARPSAGTLAIAADRAVFSDTVTSDEDAAAFWRIVDDERRGLVTETSLWQRVRAAVSLKSFTRALTPRTGPGRASPRRTERRRRRNGDATSHE